MLVATHHIAMHLRYQQPNNITSVDALEAFDSFCASVFVLDFSIIFVCCSCVNILQSHTECACVYHSTLWIYFNASQHCWNITKNSRENISTFTTHHAMIKFKRKTQNATRRMCICLIFRINFIVWSRVLVPILWNFRICIAGTSNLFILIGFLCFMKNSPMLRI